MNDALYVSIAHLLVHGWKISGGALVSPFMNREELTFLDWMSKP